MADERTSRLDADSDAKLLRAAQAGCPDAFTELFRRYYPSVRRACLRRLGNSVDADEVAQATFVRAFERLDQCEGQRRFGAWVHVIGQRLCVDTMRARARTHPEEVPVPVEQPSSGSGNPEETVLDQERLQHLREALSMLSERQRDAVVARTVEERGPGEIAAELGLSVGAVDSLLLRGRRRLARVYQRFSDERGAAAATVTAISAATVATGAAARPRRLASGFSSAASHVHHTALQLASTVGLVPASRPPGHGVATAVLTAVLAVQSAPAASTLADRYEPFAFSAPSAMPVRSPVGVIPNESVGASARDGSLTALVAGLLDAARPVAAAPDASAAGEARARATEGVEARSLVELAEAVLGPLPPVSPGEETEAAVRPLAELVLPLLEKGGTAPDSASTEPSTVLPPAPGPSTGDAAESTTEQDGTSDPTTDGASSDPPEPAPVAPGAADSDGPSVPPAVPPQSPPLDEDLIGAGKKLAEGAKDDLKGARLKTTELLP